MRAYVISVLLCKLIAFWYVHWKVLTKIGV